jgi:hypothetical protein
MSLPRLPRGIRAPEGGDPVALFRELCVEGIGDGLPVVPPTQARVAAMLAGRDPAEVVGLLAPLYREVTVEDLAVCAVLAGAGPEHLPALIAGVRAAQEPGFNLLGVATTTGTTAIGLILHGPYAREVQANSGSNCMGPGNVTNATLGRAFSFALRAGGMIPGTLDMSTMGHPGKYGFCFAEAEHVSFPCYCSRIGLSREANAVSVFAAGGSVEVVDTHSDTAIGLLETLASALPVLGTASAEGTFIGSGEPLIIIPPEWADRMAKDGISAAQACVVLYERSSIPVDRLSPSIAGSLTDSVRAAGRVSAARSPESIVLIVAGGVGTKATYLPMWQGGSTISTSPIR